MENAMPMFQEGRSRRAWRREVAEMLVDRLDREGELRFVGTRLEDRREMLRIAELMPDDVVAELYEDLAYPGMTFMELRFTREPSVYDASLRVVYSDRRRDVG
ncbi:MAG: hypothetical protein A2Z12_02280 [Actinobacteria bacterium RBG_16_68_21]|nr:MAG: hypothetical protein A2Z12_02280 [Actinobacteria bacterium RBG_16_68_21]